MKFIRVLLVAVICCSAAGSAFANNIHVVFDPETPIQNGTFGLIQDPTAVYDVAWQKCTDPGIPGIFGPPTPSAPGNLNDDACIALDNDTNPAVSINSLTLSFTVTSALVGDTISCDPLDGFLSSNNCGSVSTDGFTLGQVVTVQFFSGMPVPPNMNFFFGETGVALADMPDINITAPEPSSLTLLAAGMGLIGLCMVFAKR
jgi:hypothetical protein